MERAQKTPSHPERRANGQKGEGWGGGVAGGGRGKGRGKKGGEGEGAGGGWRRAEAVLGMWGARLGSNAQLFMVKAMLTHSSNSHG